MEVDPGQIGVARAKILMAHSFRGYYVSARRSSRSVKASRNAAKIWPQPTCSGV